MKPLEVSFAPVDNQRLARLCGALDENLRQIETALVVSIARRGERFTLRGEIRISLDTADGMARLRVADTGTGVDAEELPHLFERFRRVEGARGRSIEGSGIGLALVQELVKLHGGTIEVESTVGEEA